ncbi:MAG: NIPSNAP family protein [Chloroflexi bacterium]|nr:NIPSNAP family protein [Chloroflexota bacterium]
MLYELRIYHATPGKMSALHKRFETITLQMWEQYGIRPVGFWTTLIGESSNDLYYLLAWESLAEREQKWTAFASDPDWIRARGETEKDGPLTTHITNWMLTPTAYSAMK